MTDSEDDDAPAGEKGAEEKGERIARRLARAGLCSRREAERWIAEGRVRVDGNKLTTPAFLVTDQSRIVVDGKPLPVADRTRLWRYHKPAGLVTSHKDPQGRPTVFERLPGSLPRVVSVGRLDLNSEGLLLLTNDGALARKLELPSNGWLRRYRVRIHGKPEPEQLTSLARGVTIDGERYGSIKAVLDRQQGANAWLTVGLTEGRNREIRKVMSHLGFSVSRLIRVSYGPFQLGLLEPSQVDEVATHVIKEQLGGEKTPRNRKPRKDKANTEDSWRIVGGQFRGRVLSSPDGQVTRPTADRVREALFNILTGGVGDLDGLTVLDVFAGTGALGFEALSRGAAHVSFIENDPAALRVIGENIRKLGVAERTALLRLDATKPTKAAKPFDLVMLDAPYRSGLAGVALLALDKMGWLAPDPTITVEVAAAEPFKAPGKDFTITDERKYGAARVVFLKRVGTG